MKILSYNIYGVMDTKFPVPTWNERLENIGKILNKELKDNEIKVCCFQEVNKNNIDLLERVMMRNGFIILERDFQRKRNYIINIT